MQRKVRTSEAFGRNVKVAMAAKGVEAQVVAETLNVSVVTVSRWRKGELPGDANLERLATLLATDGSWLLADHDDPTRPPAVQEASARYPQRMFDRALVALDTTPERALFLFDMAIDEAEIGGTDLGTEDLKAWGKLLYDAGRRTGMKEVRSLYDVPAEELGGGNANAR